MVSAGAGARRKGHDGERAVARHLTRWGGWGKVVTTRFANGAGFQSGADLCRQVGRRQFEELPVAIEVKARQVWRPDEWMRQAEEQSGGRRFVVVVKRERRAVGAWWVLVPDDVFGWVAVELDRWLAAMDAR